MHRSPEVIAAAALLATVHHLMTGREISICEELVTDGEGWHYPDWDYFQACNGAEFNSLTVQFSREIANWINKAA